jgi:hypothetical protein
MVINPRLDSQATYIASSLGRGFRGSIMISIGVRKGNPRRAKLAFQFFSRCHEFSVDLGG